MIILFNNLDKQIIKKIKEYKNIVIARHIGPDPDAIASQVALRNIIKFNYEDKNVYSIGIGVSKFKYIGILDKLPDDFDKSEALLIILDVSYSTPNIFAIHFISLAYLD